MPANLSFAQAAAVPLAVLTAWQLLFERFEISPGDRQQRLAPGAASMALAHSMIERGGGCGKIVLAEQD